MSNISQRVFSYWLFALAIGMTTVFLADDMFNIANSPDVTTVGLLASAAVLASGFNAYIISQMKEMEGN